MTPKVKLLPYNHNGKRPPASGMQTAGGTFLINNKVKNGHPSRKRSIIINNITLILISSSFLICCCCLGEEVLWSAGGGQSAARQKQHQHQRVHDSISDSSSSHQAPVSNLSVRSQKPTSEGGQSERASEVHKNNPNNRLLVVRDLSTSSVNKRPAPTSSPDSDSNSDSDEQPASNNNNNNNDTDNNNNSNEPAATGEGPLNGAGDESEAGSGSSDDSGTDYESSETTESPATNQPASTDPHGRLSRQSITTTTTTSTTRRPAEMTTTTATTDFRSRQKPQFVSNPTRGGGGGSLSPGQPRSSVEPTTVNVNMGSDRILIKPHHNQPPAAITTPTAAPTTRRQSTIVTAQPTGSARREQQEPRTSESVNHEFITTTRNPQASNTNINERRQDLLLYPTNSNSNHHNSIYESRPTTFMPRMGGYLSPSQQDQHPDMADFQQQQQQQQQQASICYTPLAIMLVVLMTMMTTLVVCFCTHFLFKHYARRNQFDLVASSRQFDTKHAGLAATTAADPNWPSGAIGGQPANKQNGNNNASGLFNGPFPVAINRAEARMPPPNRRDDEFAFDNPYFRDEQLRQQQQQLQQDEQLRQQRTVNPVMATGVAAPPGGSDQMHSFIQHHISNLHARQVTSSVRELSGAKNNNNNNNNHQLAAAPQRDQCGGEPFQVVDLTSQEQRNKIIADPKEGDLIAVDITGHDFIGLGFDVCGNQQEGIFVRSLLSRGPAKESGCMEIGDRIKCINISFENITLQDARDILNCGAPYKMRLLLEKGAAALVSRPPSAMMAPTKRGSRKAAQTLLDNYRHQDNNNNNKQQPIRACLRKLGNFVGRSDYDDEHKRQLKQQLPLTRANLSEQQLVDFEQQAGGWLGSAAARHQRALTSPFSEGHLNLAFGGSESELPQQRMAGETMNVDTNKRTSRLESIDNEQLDEMFAVQTDKDNEQRRRNSSPQEQEQQHQHPVPMSQQVEDSLEHFRPQNANHRLHGPSDGGNNLHLDTADDDDDDNYSTDDGDHDAGAGRSTRHRRRRHRSKDLEQTQSQPEIAPRAPSSSNSQFYSQHEQFHMKNIGRDIVDGDENNSVDQWKQNDYHHQKMSSSISTPTMNLLPLTGGGGLERRMSSRRRRKEEIRPTISEEPTTETKYVDNNDNGTPTN